MIKVENSHFAWAIRSISTFCALAAITTTAHADWVTGGPLPMICPTPMGIEKAGNAILNMPAGTDVGKLVEGLGCYIVQKGLKFVPTELVISGSTVEGVIFASDGQSFHVFINRGGIVEQ